MECYKQGSKIGNMRGNGGKGTGIKKHNWQVQNRQGDVKNSVGNGEGQRNYMRDPWT